MSSGGGRCYSAIEHYGFVEKKFRHREENRDYSTGVVIRPNENKMSDGGRDRASLEVEVWKSS